MLQQRRAQRQRELQQLQQQLQQQQQQQAAAAPSAHATPAAAGRIVRMAAAAQQQDDNCDASTASEPDDYSDMPPLVNGPPQTSAPTPQHQQHQQQYTSSTAAAQARAAGRIARMVAAAAAAAATQQDDNCDGAEMATTTTTMTTTQRQQQQQQQQQQRLPPRAWSPGSPVADDFSDMPMLINASPPPPMVIWRDPPALSPVRQLLAAPPQESSDYPVQMELDDSEGDDAAPPLLDIDAGMLEWLAPRPWHGQQEQQQQEQQQQQGRPQQQHQQQRERGRQGAGAAPSQGGRSERLNLLSAFPQMRPPRATGPRSRPGTRRTTTGPPLSARSAWASASQQASMQEAAAARSRQHMDALYASAVQQVWARSARVSADLLAWNGSDDAALAAAAGASLQQLEQQPLLQSPGQRQRQQEEQQEYVQLQQVQQVPLSPSACRVPASCSFLQPGLTLTGHQKLLQRGSMRREDQWAVRVVLHEVDHAQGRVSGSMRALDVAGAAGPIDTYWEGEIVDDVHNTFWTHGWGASRETDLRHWSKFEAFADIKPLVIQHGGRCGRLQQHPTIFMRWKEEFFIHSKEECGLTIAGFYYIALDRCTGTVSGFYYDKNSSPFQALTLTPCADTDSSSASGGSSSGGRRSSSNAGSTDASTSQSGAASSSSGSRSSSAGGGAGGGVAFGSFDFA